MPANDDDLLLAELRRIVDQIDPVPGAVQVAARDALRWRAADVEHAVLLGDAIVDEPDSGHRTLTFGAAELTIELSVEATDRGAAMSLAGQIRPAQTAVIVIRQDDELVATRADDGGRFRAVGIPAGLVSVCCRLHERLVETEPTAL